MYQQALQGYEKANTTITTYPRVLNTIANLSLLFERQADIAKASTMYSKALIRYEKVFRPDYPRSQGLQDHLRALDAVMENTVLAEVEEPVNNLQGGLSDLGIEEAL
jgi:Tfp pilus assembly protein PilF